MGLLYGNSTKGASSDGTSLSDKVARAVRAARRAALPPSSRVGGPSGVLPRGFCMDGVSIRFATNRKRDREIYRFGRMVGDGLVCLGVVRLLVCGRSGRQGSWGIGVV